tara:strand:+ start:3160 stop:3771 length:612 start_codon:yes stop_codon:yes gene_type:complete
MKKKICILDYGLGNIRSLKNSLNRIGYNCDFFSDALSKNYDVVFIPGVGSFSKASKLIKQKKIIDFLEKIKNKSFIFGICLGMQILMREGEENKKSKGLNYISGNVKKLDKVDILPSVGFQKVYFNKSTDFKFLTDYSEKKFYFVHSYHAVPNDKKNIIGYSKYMKIKYCAAIKNQKIFGTQFHPEKSGEIGLNFLKSFLKNV